MYIKSRVKFRQIDANISLHFNFVINNKNKLFLTLTNVILDIKLHIVSAPLSADEFPKFSEIEIVPSVSTRQNLQI